MKLALITLFAVVAYSQAQRFKFGKYNPFGFRSPFAPNPFTIRPVEDPEQPAEDQQLLCTSYADYKAQAFDAIRFVTTTAYRDGNGLRTIFEDDDGTVGLYDFPAGKVSISVGGFCGYYENENFKLSVADAVNQLTVNFEIDDFAGSSGQGYTVSNGDVTYRGVINAQCADVYNLVAINNIPETIIFYTGFDYNFDVTAKFAEVDALFADYNARNNCTKVDVDFNDS